MLSQSGWYNCLAKLFLKYISGIRIVVIHVLPKDETPVRFWYPAHYRTSPDVSSIQNEFKIYSNKYGSYRYFPERHRQREFSFGNETDWRKRNSFGYWCKDYFRFT